MGSWNWFFMNTKGQLCTFLYAPEPGVDNSWIHREDDSEWLGRGCRALICHQLPLSDIQCWRETYHVMVIPLIRKSHAISIPRPLILQPASGWPRLWSSGVRTSWARLVWPPTSPSGFPSGLPIVLLCVSTCQGSVGQCDGWRSVEGGSDSDYAGKVTGGLWRPYMAWKESDFLVVGFFFFF
jgi:hypothetical protein